MVIRKYFVCFLLLFSIHIVFSFSLSLSFSLTHSLSHTLLSLILSLSLILCLFLSISSISFHSLFHSLSLCHPTPFAFLFLYFSLIRIFYVNSYKLTVFLCHRLSSPVLPSPSIFLSVCCSRSLFSVPHDFCPPQSQLFF